MISSISSSGIKSISSSKTGKSNEDQIKILQHQKAAVQKQIDNIKNGSLDTRTKQELIKPLQGQIQSIEAQIQQVQMDQIDNKDSISASRGKTQTIFDTSESGLENKIKLSKDTF